MASSDADYELLPSSESDLPKPTTYSRLTARRRLRILARVIAANRFKIIVGLVISVLLIAMPYGVYHYIKNKDKPPLYEAYHQRELNMPQHNPDLPFPEGKTGKYLFVSSHLDGYGWGNYMQEFVWDAYLAHKSGRAFVFDNYTWDRHGPEYSKYKGRTIIPSRIPLTAYFQGPIVGDAFPLGNNTPRAVRQEYFAKVCPEPAKIIGHDVIDTYVWGSTKTLIEKWLEKFEAADNRCIEIPEGTGEPFTIFTFGTKNVLDAWDDFVQSPIMTGFRWSHLIESGFQSNLMRVHPPSGNKSASYDQIYPYTALDGLLVLQLRRGDYVEHCFNLLNWGAQWQGFNRFPQYPDQFTTVEGAGSGNISEAAQNEHLKRCYPTPHQIAQRVGEIIETDSGKGLENVYIMTNGKVDFIDDVKRELYRIKKWNSITSSRDLLVNREQEYVKQAIDMLIGLRSHTFIGNGWSSMSSNVNMLRMAILKPHPNRTRFW